MKVYYGSNTNDYIDEHMTMEDIEKLILPRLHNQSVAIGKDIQKPSCDN